jgi:hypothetical protein
MTATAADLGLELDDQGKAAIVVFDPELLRFNSHPVAVEMLSLAHGGKLEYLTLSEGQVFHYGPSSFAITGE